MSGTQTLVGIHAVREALRAATRPLQYLAVVRDRHDARVQELLEMARAAQVPVRFEPREALDRLARTAQHQGVVALAAAKQALDLDELLAELKTKHAAAGSRPGLLLALDGVEDPHNLGAILRSACASGVEAVVLPTRRSAGLTETVERISAGALEYVPVARATNLVQGLERVKRAGYWLVGLDEKAPNSLWDHDFKIPTALVVGAEGTGLHQLTRQSCDFLVSISMAPGVASLNVSVAAAVVLFEIIRQRRAG